MPARLYLRPQPRAFFLLTETHALVFRQPGSSESKASKRSVVVAEFLPLEEVDTTGLVLAGRGMGIEGVLGVTSVLSDRSPIPEVFLLLLTTSALLPPLIPGSSLRPSRVVSVEFHSLTSNFWDPPGLLDAGYDDWQDEHDAAYISQSQGGYSRTGQGGAATQSLAAQAGVEDPCAGMKKYLESGGFFHAEACRFDISRRLGLEGTNMVAAAKGHVHPLEGFDDRFVWNGSLLAPLIAFRAGLSPAVRAELDAHALLLPIIQGFVGSTALATGSWSAEGPDQGLLSLISRLSCKRAGARFRTRGIDDDGNVANFVETETILTVGHTSLSYTQVRGSVPLFWQQPQQGLGTLQQRVEITRPPQATQPAFDKHFRDLLDHYNAVHAVNLLGQKDAEAMLSAAYQDRFTQLRNALKQAFPQPPSDKPSSPPPELLVYTAYDFHAVVRLGGHDAVRSDLSASPDVTRSMNQFGITAVDKITGDTIEQQHGVFRTNCLDCLDRTNFVQEVLSYVALRRFLAAHGSAMLNSPTLWAAHRELWADNGDRLSKTYAGTGAINTSATRSGKKTLAGLLSDATKSVGRAYINNFQDKGKQLAIDMLLGLMAGQRPVVLFDPVGDSIHSALAERKPDYSSPRQILFFSGTWNVNGKPANEPLNPWLFPRGAPLADIYAIAFQEIVELTPQQIVQTDPAKKRKWEIAIMDTFSSQCGPNEYILMRSEQLVGTALMIVVKASLLSAIRNIEYADRKTGLQGLSGNKGGVGIRFDLYDASICLMTCHLAAGQSNYADRNADYRTISQGLTFLRGKTIDSHDIVIWAADFNYRVDLSNEEARGYAESDRLDELFAADQLAMAMDDGEVFQGYIEGPLTFRPTYKYDNGTDVYDSSEKQRIPSWTDRVLFKGTDLGLLAYQCADLRSSDHRPVYAIIRAQVAEVDEEKKAKVAAELLKTAREKNGGAKIDDRVEAASRGGVRSVVKEFTSVSLTSSPAPSRSTSPTGGQRGLGANRRPLAPPISRDRKPIGLKSTTASTLNAINSAYERIGIPPPLPPRNGAAAAPAAAPVVGYEARKRAPPPPPANEFKRIGLPPPVNTTATAAPAEEAEITPVATGDFVIVPSPNAPPAGAKRPPPLPARTNMIAPSQDTSSTPTAGSGSVAQLADMFSTPNPTPIHARYTARKPVPVAPAASPPPRLPVRRSSTLDMDAPPPANLIAPVAPDNSPLKKAVPAIPARKPTLPTAAAVVVDEKKVTAEPKEETRDGKEDVKKAPPPIPRKPSVSLAATTQTSAATSPVEAEKPAVTKPPLAPKPALAPKPSTSPPATTTGPPSIPSKPAGLKLTTSSSSVPKAEEKEKSTDAEAHVGVPAAPEPTSPKPSLAPKPAGLKGRQLSS